MERRCATQDYQYHLIRWAIRLFIWHGRASGRENIPSRGPAVFIGNHCGPWGPLGCISSVDQRLYPWTISQMVDAAECPPYMQVDFVEKSLRLKPPLSARFSHSLAKIVVPLLNGIGCIPVYKFQGALKAHLTLKLSLKRLLEGKGLLILPEVPEWEEDPQTGMHHFSKSSLYLVDMYHRETGQPLTFAPFVVIPSHRIRFLAPRRLIPQDQSDAGGREAWMAALEGEIKRTYLEMKSL